MYCTGNPVKYVDPDGNAPWDNHYIQVAQSEASSTGEKYSQWTGQNGCVYASVQTTSVVSDGCGGMALEAAGTTAVGTAVTVAGMLNSADDIGTNANGESFLQQQSATETGKNIVGYTKKAISVLNSFMDIKALNNSNSLIEKANSCVDLMNNSSGIIKSIVDENN